MRDHCHRLIVATVQCEDIQSLKRTLFVEGRYGWTVSTSERLQCYAYSLCTLLLFVPSGCRVNEICSPYSRVAVKKVIPIRAVDNELVPTPG